MNILHAIIIALVPVLTLYLSAATFAQPISRNNMAAYCRHVDDKQGGQAPVIDGFSGDQRYFLSWAQVWRPISTEAEIRHRLATDVHSPYQFRANGAVRNVDAWYEAFDVGPDDDLYLPPGQRVRIW